MRKCHIIFWYVQMECTEVYAVFKRAYFTRALRDPYTADPSFAPLQLFGTAFINIFSNCLPCEFETGNKVSVTATFKDGSFVSIHEVHLMRHFPTQFDASVFMNLEGMPVATPFWLHFRSVASGREFIRPTYCVCMDLNAVSPFLLITNPFKTSAQRIFKRYSSPKEAFIECCKITREERDAMKTQRAVSGFAIRRFETCQLLSVETANRILERQPLPELQLLQEPLKSDICVDDIFTYCSLFYSDSTLLFPRF